MALPTIKCKPCAEENRHHHHSPSPSEAVLGNHNFTLKTLRESCHLKINFISEGGIDIQTDSILKIYLFNYGISEDNSLLFIGTKQPCPRYIRVYISL